MQRPNTTKTKNNDIYTRMLCKPDNNSWQQCMTNKELYCKITLLWNSYGNVTLLQFCTGTKFRPCPVTAFPQSQPHPRKHRSHPPPRARKFFPIPSPSPKKFRPVSELSAHSTKQKMSCRIMHSYHAAGNLARQSADQHISVNKQLTVSHRLESGLVECPDSEARHAH